MDKSKLYLKQIEVGPMENFVYLIGDKESKECVMIDPAWEVDRVIRIARQDDMKVTAGLCTHAHYDHINGAEELISKTGGKIYIHKKDAPYVKEIQSDLKKVDSEYKLKVGNISMTFLHTPGHTPGSQCFLVENHLVSGDTLFLNGCGRCDMPGGDPEQMYESLQRLGKLQDKVQVMPGHHYAELPSTDLQEVKRTNPYYQMKSKQDFLNLRMGN